MRLFIAINFDENVKNKRLRIQRGLMMGTTGGNFSHKENLHLTLAFLGEVAEKELTKLHGIIDGLKSQPFDITIGALDMFRGGDICYLDLSAPKELFDLQKGLTSALKASGFQTDKKKYTPHLTIAREVKFSTSFSLIKFNDSISPIHSCVSRVSLMKSERIKGKLTYTEIYGKDLTI